MDENECEAVIFHNFRSHFYNQMIDESKSAADKFRNTVKFHFYHAIGLLLNNRVDESAALFESIKQENDVKLAATIALIYAKRMLRVSNRKILERLDSEMREIRKHSDATQFYHSAVVLLALNKADKCLDYLEKALVLQPEHVEASILKAWLTLQKTPEVSERLFEQVLKGNKKNLDACIGLSESLLHSKKYEQSLEAVNKAVVRFPNSHLPLVQKMRVYFATQDWEHCLETANRIPDRIEAIKVRTLVEICRNCDYESGANLLAELSQILDEKEWKNAIICYEIAGLFARICGRNSQILELTQNLCEKCVEINVKNCNFLIELAHQCLLKDDVKSAEKYFRNAVKIDEKSFDALLGITWCDLLSNSDLDRGEKQIEFLIDFEESKNSAFFYYVRSRVTQNAQDAVVFLKKSSDLLLMKSKPFPYSDIYLFHLNPDLMLSIIKEYLKYDSNSSRIVLDLLKIIIESLPEMYESLYLLAKIQYSNLDYNEAISNLDKILKRNSEDEQSLLLIARIQCDLQNYDRALQTLENGLSNNFKIRDNPIYHHIRGIVESKLGNPEDSIQFLSNAVELLGNSRLATDEQAAIYAELIRARMSIGQIEEAANLLEAASAMFRGTAEDSRMTVLRAEQAIVFRNTDDAIELLKSVKPTEKYYVESRKKLADLLLNTRKDKFAYLDCFKDILSLNTSAESYFLLGDAYKNVNDTEEAVSCYKKALESDPKDAKLNVKMGRFLIEIGDLEQAVDFYKDSIKVIEEPELKLELARLYFELRQYEKAEALLLSELESDNNAAEDLTYLQYKTKILMLLGLVQEKRDATTALATFKDVWDNQNRVRKRFLVEKTQVPEKEMQLIVQIARKLAELSIFGKKYEQGVQYFKEGLEICLNNVELLVGLAQLYMKMSSYDQCQQLCARVLEREADNEEVSLLMADISFRKLNFDMAQFHFSQLLQKRPTFWSALARLIEISRRTGNFDEIPEFLSNAQSLVHAQHPSLAFCTGLYHKYTANPNAALRSFNQARNDEEFAAEALLHMIDICVNPEDNLLEEQYFFDVEDTEYHDSKAMALKTAEKLLKDLKKISEEDGATHYAIRYKLAKNFWFLQQDKQGLERGLDEFVNLAGQTQYKDNIGVVLGLAMGYTLLKQGQRAKNQLKRVVKMEWNFEEADFLEKCWILLADHYIQSAKFDVASDLLNKVLQYNKSYGRAYELLGFICEKEQRFEDAVGCYESAWKYTGRMNSNIGYKLGLNYVKCKEYADAIDVAHQVMKLKPDHGKIKKDVLDKAINNLRI